MVMADFLTSCSRASVGESFFFGLGASGLFFIWASSLAMSPVGVGLSETGMKPGCSGETTVFVSLACSRVRAGGSP